MKNIIFQSRDLRLRALDANSSCGGGVRRNECKNGIVGIILGIY